MDEWSEAFHKMTSLELLRCEGMRYYINIKKVDESTFDKNTSTVEYPDDIIKGSGFIGTIKHSQMR